MFRSLIGQIKKKFKVIRVSPLLDAGPAAEVQLSSHAALPVKHNVQMPDVQRYSLRHCLPARCDWNESGSTRTSFLEG